MQPDDQIVDDTPRQKRQTITGHHVSQPRQFSLMILKNQFSNTAPVLLTSLLNNTFEDGASCSDLTIKDKEGDTANFTLVTQPFHGHVNLSIDGRLCYKPKSNYNGNDNVTVQIQEVIGGHSPILPTVTTVSVMLVIGSVNDPPDMYFGTRDNVTMDTKINNQLEVLLEANRTAGFALGTYVAVDIDRHDFLTYDTQQQTIPGLNFSFVETKAPLEFLSGDIMSRYNSTDPSVMRSFDLSVTITPSISYGEARFGLLVFDKDKYFSKIAWFNVFVLRNPCVYGTCSPKANTNVTCEDTIRATHFSQFVCSCTPGYKDEWCQTEIDECRPQPCPLMFDCEDQINSYKCNINAAKLMAILVCIAAAVGLIAFIIYKKKPRRKSTKVSDIW